MVSESTLHYHKNLLIPNEVLWACLGRYSTCVKAVITLFLLTPTNKNNPHMQQSAHACTSTFSLLHTGDVYCFTICFSYSICSLKQASFKGYHFECKVIFNINKWTNQRQRKTCRSLVSQIVTVFDPFARRSAKLE